MAERVSKVMLNAVAATATSVGVDVSQMKKVSIHILATSMDTGEKGDFTIDVSNDQGASWVSYNRIVSNVTHTNVQTEALVNMVELAFGGATSGIILFPPGDHFEMVRVTCTISGSKGRYSAYLDAI